MRNLRLLTIFLLVSKEGKIGTLCVICLYLVINCKDEFFVPISKDFYQD